VRYGWRPPNPRGIHCARSGRAGRWPCCPEARAKRASRPGWPPAPAPIAPAPGSGRVTFRVPSNFADTRRRHRSMPLAEIGREPPQRRGAPGCAPRRQLRHPEPLGRRCVDSVFRLRRLHAGRPRTPAAQTPPPARPAPPPSASRRGRADRRAAAPGPPANGSPPRWPRSHPGSRAPGAGGPRQTAWPPVVPPSRPPSRRTPAPRPPPGSGAAGRGARSTRAPRRHSLVAARGRSTLPSARRLRRKAARGAPPPGAARRSTCRPGRNRAAPA